MLRTRVAVTATAALIGLALACSNSSAPLAPTVASPSGTASTAPDGSTLKASAPIPISPVSDQALTSTPTLTSGASTPTFGGSAVFQYRFQVFDPTNALVQDSGLVSSPTFSVTAGLAAVTRYTWHARAEYQGSVGPWSTTASFISPQPFDMRQAVILNNPPDMGSWPETSKITYIQFRSDALIVDFDKRTGDGAWVNLPFTPGDPPTGDGIQYTLGMCFHIGPTWYCSAPIQFWQGRDLTAAGAPSQIPALWYYDPARWGPMSGYVPAQGETVGIFAAVGNVRNILSSALLLAKERTNVALVPFDNGSGSTYTFSAGQHLLTLPASLSRR
jgi:hypothetical protein